MTSHPVVLIVGVVVLAIAGAYVAFAPSKRQRSGDAGVHLGPEEEAPEG